MWRRGDAFGRRSRSSTIPRQSCAFFRARKLLHLALSLIFNSYTREEWSRRPCYACRSYDGFWTPGLRGLIRSLHTKVCYDPC
ncbi:hypothetical protein BV25DRAFT_335260 [Artomyces pyxidatus]|uniref:Uncharacterized protein n=1 Tax=Artomyces pyxidatus TaxID=48021 RepID=A0ACB8T7W0_9AGAM|nr:hypothetical protein BV25DRAFT_335260 [Artomyces pyxidatus]